MEYIEKVEAGILPVDKGYLLSREEQITREAIEMLMCNYRIDWNELSEQLSVPARSIKRQPPMTKPVYANLQRTDWSSLTKIKSG